MTSDELRVALKSSSETLAAIARRAGVPYTTLHSFLSGETKTLRADTFQKVSAALQPPRMREVREDAQPFETAGQVSVTVPAHLVKLAEEHDLDLPALIAEGGLDAVEAAGRKAWYEANRDVIEAKRRQVEKHGTFAQRHGVFPGRK